MFQIQYWFLILFFSFLLAFSLSTNASNLVPEGGDNTEGIMGAEGLERSSVCSNTFLKHLDFQSTAPSHEGPLGLTPSHRCKCGCLVDGAAVGMGGTCIACLMPCSKFSWSVPRAVVEATKRSKASTWKALPYVTKGIELLQEARVPMMETLPFSVAGKIGKVDTLFDSAGFSGSNSSGSVKEFNNVRTMPTPFFIEFSNIAFTPLRLNLKEGNTQAISLPYRNPIYNFPTFLTGGINGSTQMSAGQWYTGYYDKTWSAFYTQIFASTCNLLIPSPPLFRYPTSFSNDVILTEPMNEMFQQMGTFMENGIFPFAFPLTFMINLPMPPHRVCMPLYGSLMPRTGSSIMSSWIRNSLVSMARASGLVYGMGWPLDAQIGLGDRYSIIYPRGYESQKYRFGTMEVYETTDIASPNYFDLG